MACFSVLCKLLSLALGSSARKMDSRTRLFFLPGSSAVFSFSQTRPWLVFRCYVNFFLSRSGPAREKWALGPDFSHFSGLAHGKWALGPGLSHFSGLTWHFPSLRPNYGLFFGVMQTFFSHARVQRAKNGLSDPTFPIFRV